MLDPAILNQLKLVFTRLEHPVVLLAAQSDHEKQGELLEMLQELSSCSPMVELKSADESSEIPRFWLEYGGQANGVAFSGIPGGHEFSSLVLAILNSDSKGKLPDDALIQRIRRLKGPIMLRTYISLSCENCPEVVQSLNLMAILHPDFSHEMIDGAFAQEEIERLAIAGVPAVYTGDTMLSSGKAGLSELLDKLEAHFGEDEAAPQAEARDLGVYDVTVVGAGPAGVAAAVYTSRKGLKTLVLSDRVGGQVLDTKGIENFISVPYTEGPQLAAQMAQHLEENTIETLKHRRVEKVWREESSSLSHIELNTRESLQTRALIIATGAKWRELGIEGEKDYLGRGVAFCPTCDGPFYKGKDVVVVGGGNSGVEAAIDLAGIVKSVTVVEFLPELKADEVLVKRLNSLTNTSVIKNARSTRIVGDNQKVTAIEYEDRSTGKLHELRTAGVFVQIGLVPNSQFVAELVETNRYGEIMVDEKCRTNIPGIFAAGDVTTVPYKQIVIAMGEGAKAGLAAFDAHMESL